MFVRGYQPKWIFNDLTGIPLDDTYYIFFRFNTLPYLPQPVYQDPNGNAVWSFPIQFQPNGMLPDNIFFIPDAVYRVEIRQGQTDDSPLIYVIENYLAIETEAEADPLITSSNMVTNPQFADVYFEGSYTYTQASSSTYTLNIAPGWQLVLTGAGTTIMTQVQSAGNNNLPGNPPSYLTLQNSGWTKVVLQQVFSNNGAIFANGAVAITFLANATSSAQIVSAVYAPSVGTPQNIFSNGTIATGSLQYYFGLLNPVPASTNTGTGNSANVTLQFVMPGTSTLSFSNIQLVGQSAPVSAEFIAPVGMNQGSVPSFKEETYQRNVDQEFNVYQNSILDQQKHSLLTAWNFANNPWQYWPKAGQTLTNNGYTADQTIVIQQNYANGSTGSNVSVKQSSLANDLGLQITSVTATNQFALLQWIAPQSIAQYWNNIVSCMVTGFLTTTNSSSINFKVRLIYIAGLPNSTAQHDPITSWTSGGDPVAASGYTLITPPLDPVYTLGSSPQQFTFDGMQLPVSTNANMTLGILVYTISNMTQTGTPDFIVFNDISLVPNSFALPTQAETYDQTFKKCQYYYEMSYENFANVGTGTQVSALMYVQVADSNNAATDTQFWPATFNINYKNVKNKSPTLTVYAANSGTVANVSSVVYSGTSASGIVDYPLASNYTVSSTGLFTATFLSLQSSSVGTQAAGVNAPQVAYIMLHYTANSRLG